MKGVRQTSGVAIGVVLCASVMFCVAPARSQDVPVWNQYANSMLIKTRTAATYPENLWVFTLVGYYQDLDNTANQALNRKQATYVAWAEYGVRNWMQLGVAMPYIMRETKDAATGADDKVNGLGDLNLYGKCRLLTENASRPALTVDGFVKVPTGDKDKGLSNDKTDVTVAAEASKRFGLLSLHFNPEYVFTGGDKASLGAPADDRFNLNVGVMWHATASLVPMIEYNGFWWRDNGKESDVGGGVLWFPTKNTSVKLGVAFPVSENVTWKPDWTPWVKLATWF